MESATASFSAATTTTTTAPLHGYYAVRKGKGGLRDCIFVSWDCAKEYVVTTTGENTTTSTNNNVEFSFFAKWEDAVQYIHPSTTKSYADICTTTTTTEEKKKKEEESTTITTSKKQQQLSPNKRKRLAVLGRPSKRCRIPINNNNNTTVDDDAEGDVTVQDKDTTTNNESSSEPEDSETGDNTMEEEGTTTSTAAPLNLLLEQGYHQNLAKGWRSQHLHLCLTRRDHKREPALKQYLQDLVDLQNYRAHSILPVRLPDNDRRHCSGASHPLSVHYLNYAWGVSQSYHRDIRRQQKNKPSSSNVGEGGGSCAVVIVDLPHFKSHSLPRPSANTTITNKVDDDTTTSSSDNDNHKKKKKKSGAITGTTNNIPKSSLPYLLEKAYLGFRHRGWRARQILSATKLNNNDNAADHAITNNGKASNNQEPNEKIVISDNNDRKNSKEPNSDERNFDNKNNKNNDSQDTTRNGFNPNNDGSNEPIENTLEGRSSDNNNSDGEKSTENSTGNHDNNKRQNTANSVNEKNPGNIMQRKDNSDSMSEPRTLPNRDKLDMLGKESEKKPGAEDAGTTTTNKAVTRCISATLEKLDNHVVNGQEPQSSNNITRENMEATNNTPNQIIGDNVNAAEIQYRKDLEELRAFRRAHPQELQRYSGNNNIAENHPSTIPSPFAIDYLQWSWGKDIFGEDIEDEDSDQSVIVVHGESKSSVVNRENKSDLPLRPRLVGAAPASHSLANTSLSQPTPSLALSVGLTGINGIGEDMDEDTPPLIESLRANWFAMKDKGWRAAELGFPQGGNNRRYNSMSRKERERLYLVDLEVLKEWWATYPSSQHYVFTVPEEEEFHPEGIDRSKFPYGRSGKNNNCKYDRRHKSGINAPWSLTFLNWSWGVSNSYNRDLVRKGKRKVKQDAQQSLYI